MAQLEIESSKLGINIHRYSTEFRSRDLNIFKLENESTIYLITTPFVLAVGKTHFPLGHYLTNLKP